MNQLVTPNHPDPDDLADLAAEVLDPEQAAVLRHHVEGCDDCGRLLDDAARVRSLLLAEDPGPMPEEVWLRLESALAEESAARAAVGGSSSPAVATLAAAGEPEATEPAAGHPAGVTVLSRDTDDDAPPAKLRRPARRVHTTRRQQRDDRSGRWATFASSVGWGGMAAVAAGVLVVIGLGATLLHGLLPEDAGVAAGLIAREGSDDSKAGGAAESRPAQILVSTGTDYTSKRLGKQVRALVARVHGTTATDGSTSESGVEANGDLSAFDGSGERSADVWTRAELTDCLKAISSQDLSPIAVDFAKLNGREVALLVLPSPSQDYEVWAVSRSCSPGNDGTLLYQIVKP